MSGASTSSKPEGSHGQRPVVATVTLEVDSPDAHFRIPTRTITLDHNTREMQLGRSSRVSEKGFTPATGNGWFDSPVMSRYHAKIGLDAKNSELQLTDTGSLHGTYVDHQRLTKHVPRPLHDGDKIRFGVQIDRGHDKFPPCHIVARVNMKDASPQPRKPEAVPGNYRVPDESDDDDSSESEHSERNNERPKTQPLPSLSSILGRPQEEEAVGRGQGAKALPKIIPTVDLTDGSDSKPVSPLEDDEVQEVPAASIKSRGPTVTISKPSPGSSPKRPISVTEVVDLTSPARDPSIDLATAEDNMETTICEPALPQDRSVSPTGSPRISHAAISEAGESSVWDGSDYSEDNEDHTSSDDSEGLSPMGDHDDVLSDDDDEIYDGDDREIDMPVGETLNATAYWEESTDSESGSDVDSDEDMEGPGGQCRPHDIPSVPPPVFSPSRVPPPASFMGLNGVDLEPRHPSPSDAVMPMKCHSSVHSAPFTGGEKSDKAEFWAAREVNRRRFCMGDHETPATQPCADVHLPPMMNTRESTIHSTALACGTGHPVMPPGPFPALGEFPGFGGNDGPSAQMKMPDTVGIHQWDGMPTMPFTPMFEPGNRIAETRRTHVGIKELVDGLDSPRGNVEPTPREHDLRRAPSFAELITSRHDSPNGDPPQAMASNGYALRSPDTRQQSVAASGARFTPASKKRSIDEISQESAEEKAWASEGTTSKQPTSSLSPNPESEEQPTPAKDFEAAEPTDEAESSAILTPPKTPETNSRPNKRRRRKLVETMGIAAFGALSASFGIFAALVATAPEFE